MILYSVASSPLTLPTYPFSFSLEWQVFFPPNENTWGFWARQHQRSLTPVMNGFLLWIPYKPYSSGKPPEKPQPRKHIQPRIEPGTARWEATMLPLDHKGGLFFTICCCCSWVLRRSLISRVISVAFYIEREKSDKFYWKAPISASGSFTWRKSTTRDQRLYFPSEAIFRIFTLWKNPSTPAGFEPTNLGSSGEYDNQWTTEVDFSFRDFSNFLQASMIKCQKSVNCFFIVFLTILLTPISLLNEMKLN